MLDISFFRRCRLKLLIIRCFRSPNRPTLPLQIIKPQKLSLKTATLFSTRTIHFKVQCIYKGGVGTSESRLQPTEAQVQPIYKGGLIPQRDRAPICSSNIHAWLSPLFCLHPWHLSPLPHQSQYRHQHKPLQYSSYHSHQPQSCPTL